MMTTPSQIISQLEAFEFVAKCIRLGLDSTPFYWTEEEHRVYKRKAKVLGITIVTPADIKKLGYELKRGAQLIGEAYYTTPTEKYIDLYVLEAQCKKAKKR